MTPVRLTVTIVILGLCACGQALELTDDFSEYADGSDGSPTWYNTSFLWQVTDGAFHFGGPSTIAYMQKQPRFRHIQMEATLILQEGTGEDWKVAGACLYEDAGNYWHVALVEAPASENKRHFWELCEMKDGAWLAQSNLETTVNTGTELDWEYGTPYRLRISLTPQGIEGNVFDDDGNQLAERAYRFTDDAVTMGRPALHTSNFRGTFDDIAVVATDSAPEPTAEEKVYPEYDVAASDLPRSEATGFFRTQKRGDRWWVIDPKGRPFFAIGTDHCRYSGHWCQDLGYAPYKRNNDEKWQSKNAWAERATGRLKSWGFNLLGAGNGAECRYKGLAHTDFISFGSTFSGYDDICPKVHWTGFPNVFNPKWPQYCDKRARQACEEGKNDPWLFGYFLDNELEWYGKSHTEWGLFDETMKKAADHTAKQALVEFLKGKYASIVQFNEAWGAELDSFEEILEREELTGDKRETVEADKIDFVRLIAEQYFKHTTAAIRKYDPNHMIIGCRFAGRAPAGIWDICGTYCDIVTFNYYGRVDLDKGIAPGHVETFTEYYEQAQKPLMITEWSFPALDSGLPCKHGAGMRVDTQEQKAECFRIYQEMFFRLPFFVGSDYFMWVDEPELGISETFPEDSNYGLVDVNDDPYDALVDMATRVNNTVYKLHSGNYPDLGVRDDYAVYNAGQAAATFRLWVRVDGALQDREITLQGGEEKAIELGRQLGPGAHLIAIEADPQRRTADADPTNNLLTEQIWVQGLQIPQALADLPVQAVAVSNHGNRAVPHAVVSTRNLPHRLLHSRALYHPQVYELSGEPVPTQLEREELLFAAGDLTAWGCKTFLLAWHRRGFKRPGEPRMKVWEQEGGARMIDNGTLQLTIPAEGSGDILNPIALGTVPLGQYNPLVWQEVDGQNQWVRTDTATVGIWNGPACVVVHATARGGADQPITAVDDEGQYEQQSATPVRFEVAHDIIVPPDTNWFLARLDYIKNTSERPLTLKGYFFYMSSFIGGNADGDTPGGPDVPNYYGLAGGAWEDEQAGCVFGAVPLDEEITARFWLDDGGGQHPDARRQLDEPQVLQPGEIYKDPARPTLLIYGAPWEDGVWRQMKENAEAVSAVRVDIEKVGGG